MIAQSWKRLLRLNGSGFFMRIKDGIWVNVGRVSFFNRYFLLTLNSDLIREKIDSRSFERARIKITDCKQPCFFLNNTSCSFRCISTGLCAGNLVSRNDQLVELEYQEQRALDLIGLAFIGDHTVLQFGINSIKNIALVQFNIVNSRLIRLIVKRDYMGNITRVYDEVSEVLPSFF